MTVGAAKGSPSAAAQSMEYSQLFLRVEAPPGDAGLY